MSNPASRTRLFGFSAVILALGPIVASQSAEANQGRETFRAVAQSMAAGLSGQTTVIIQVSRWSTEEEVAHLQGVLREENMDRMVEELQKQGETGRIRVPSEGGTGWALRYATERREDGKRYITLASDRPVDFWETVERAPRTWRYRVSLIELVLDEGDRGEGEMSVGVEFVVDPETGDIDVRDMTTTPIRLTNVRK